MNDFFPQIKFEKNSSSFDTENLEDFLLFIVNTSIEQCNGLEDFLVIVTGDFDSSFKERFGSDFPYPFEDTDNLESKVKATFTRKIEGLNDKNLIMIEESGELNRDFKKAFTHECLHASILQRNEIDPLSNYQSFPKKSRLRIEELIEEYRVELTINQKFPLIKIEDTLAQVFIESLNDLKKEFETNKYCKDSSLRRVCYISGTFLAEATVGSHLNMDKVLEKAPFDSSKIQAIHTCLKQLKGADEDINQNKLESIALELYHLVESCFLSLKNYYSI